MADTLPSSEAVEAAESSSQISGIVDKVIAAQSPMRAIKQVANVINEARKTEIESNQYIMSDDDFSLPEMGDFYLGAVDTDYLEYIDSFLNDKDKADAKRAAFYTETPALTDCGYSEKQQAYFLKATVENNTNTVDGGWLNGDQLIFKVGSVTTDGNETKQAQAALEKFKAAICAAPKNKNFDALTDEDYILFSLYGVTTHKTPKWAYESNVSKDIFNVKSYGITDNTVNTESFNSNWANSDQILLQIHDTNTYTYALESTENHWHEIDYSDGSPDADSSSFRWCIYRGEADVENARKTAQKMSEILNKVNNEVYLLIDSSGSNTSYSYIGQQKVLTTEFTEKLKKAAGNATHGALNSYCLARSEMMGNLLGTAYVKLDDKWCNLAKIILAEIDDDEVATNINVETSSSAFKNDYDVEAYEWADAFKSFYDELDDRKKIQKEIFGQEWDTLNNWTVTIGDVTLLIPPTNITVTSQIQDERTPLLRANGSMSKMGKQTVKNLTMDVYFYGSNGVNGYPYKAKLPNGKEVTYYMNGLRALVSQFKFTPFLPIENKYINDTIGIEAVTFTGISVQTCPNFPSLYQATLSFTEFQYSVYLSDLITVCLSWGCESNYFSTAFNWPVFRYYYQRSILRGEEFKEKGYAFNTFEYNKLILQNRTSLQPMKFENSKMKFYVADEDYLKQLLEAKLNADQGTTSRVSYGTNEKQAIASLAEIANTLAQKIKNDSEVQQTVEAIPTGFDNKESRKSTIKKVVGLLTPEGLTGSASEIVAKKNTEGKNQRIITISYPIKDILLDEKEIDVFTDTEKLKNFKKKCMLGMGASSADDLLQNDAINIKLVSTQQEDGSYSPYTIDTTTNDMKLLAYVDAQNEKNASYISTSDKETDTGWNINGTMASMSNLRFTSYPVGALYVTSANALLSNKITSINLIEVDGSSPQYMGGEDILIQVTLQTTDKKSVIALNNLPQFAARQLKMYRQVIPSYPVRVDSEITRFLGITDVTVEAVEVSTTPNIPGVYNITMELRSIDRTLRQREAMAMLDAQNNTDNAYSNEQGWTDVNSYFKIEDTIAQTELYPDLELPTLDEMSEIGWKFTRYKFQDTRVYVDPDFYVIYFNRLISQVIREAVVKSADNGIGSDIQYEDRTGAVITATAAKFKGIEVTSKNTEAQNQFNKVEAMKKAQEQLNVKEIKENLRKNEDNNILTNNKLELWSVCNDIKCMYMEQSYKKEYDSYVAQLKNNAVLNEKYDPTNAIEYDLSTRQEISRVFEEPVSSVAELNKSSYQSTGSVAEANKDSYKSSDSDDTKTKKDEYTENLNKKLDTDEKMKEGKWVASKLAKSREASYRIAKYLNDNPIPDDLKNDYNYEDKSGTEPIYVTARKLKEKEENQTTADKITEGLIYATTVMAVPASAGIANQIINTQATIQSLQNDLKTEIQKGLDAFLDNSEVQEILKLIPIDITKDGLKDIINDIIYSAACSTAGSKEYSSKDQSSEWKPQPDHTGKMQSSVLQGQELNSQEEDIENTYQAIFSTYCLGVFNIKVYDKDTFQKITGQNVKIELTKELQNYKKDIPQLFEYSLLDPYYRLTSIDKLGYVIEYKQQCVNSPAYCTFAFMRLILYWLMRMLDKQILPAFTTDLLRDASEAEIATIAKASSENIADEKMTNIKDTINMYSNNSVAMDAGKIWTAALYALSDGNEYLQKNIENKNYKALESFVSGTVIPDQKINYKKELNITVRKMTLALVGVKRITDTNAVGVKQDSPAAKLARQKMQKKYLEASEDPQKYLIHSCHDMIVHDARGRLLRAFPTYYMCLIDEGRTIGEYKLNDNFYNNMAISEIDIVKSRKLPADTAHVVMSNVYMSFTNENETIADYASMSESAESTLDNIGTTFKSIFTPTSYGKEMETTRQSKSAETKIMLSPGARMHIRMGYGSSAAMLPIVFNGSIAEVNTQEVVEIIAQGDGIELTNPIMEDIKAHNLQNVDDLTGSVYNGATPGEIMQDLLTVKGGFMAKVLSAAGRTDLLGRNPYGIYHFGNPDFTDIFEKGETTQNIFEATSSETDRLKNDYNAPSITFNIFGKTVWDIANICKSVTPDYICAIAPFGFRSTLFVGHPRYYYAYDYMNSNGVTMEKRKPFQQYHYYFSQTDIIGNGITATSRDMKTNAIGMYQVCATGNSIEQHKVGPLYADADIYPEYQKSMIVDTQLLGKGVPYVGTITNALTSFEFIDSMFDDAGNTVSHEKIAWKMTASALRESMMDMYAGDLVILGDPSIKPHDRMYISDTYENVDGQCLAKEVVHHMSIDQGFTTTVTPDCIITVDDPYEKAINPINKMITGLIEPLMLTKAYMWRARSLGATWGLKAAWSAFMPNAVSNFMIKHKSNAVKAGKYVSKVAASAVSKTAMSTAVTALSASKAGAMLKFVATKTVPGLLITIGCSVITNMIDRYVKNLEVVQVYPLKHFGKTWTAGMNGSKGVIVGSPTEKQQGGMSAFFGTIMGKDANTNPIIGFLKDVAFGEELSDHASSLLKDSENDEKATSNSSYSFDDILTTRTGNKGSEYTVPRDYRQMMISPRVNYDSAEELSASYENYAMLETKSYSTNPKFSNNRFIADDSRLQPYVAQGFLKILHEIPALNPGENIKQQIVKVNREEKYIKVIQQQGDDGSLIYDVPMLNPETINILYEIVRRAKNAMPSSNSSDPNEEYEKDKNSFILLESALRIGDKQTQGSTGFTFVIRGVENAAQPTIMAIAEFTSEIEKTVKEDSTYHAIFDSKDLGDNRYAIAVKMPRVTTRLPQSDITSTEENEEED